MRIVFTRSDNLFSRFIRFSTGENVSHVAIRFSDGVYAHSNFLGVRFEAEEQFEKDNEIVGVCQYPADSAREKQLHNIIHMYQGRSYDFLACLYILLNLLVRRITGYMIPGPNRWANRKLFICTELVSQVILGEHDSLITPAKLFYKLKEKYSVR